MTIEEQSQIMANETNAVQDMINEGGLGADVYYINEDTDNENKINKTISS